MEVTGIFRLYLGEYLLYAGPCAAVKKVNKADVAFAKWSCSQFRGALKVWTLGPTQMDKIRISSKGTQYFHLKNLPR